MNLADQAAYVCGKINQSEANDVATCKGFLTRRHEMLWNDQIWKDSLVEFTQVLSPDGYTTASTWLPASGVLLLPTIIQRVIAVRSDTTHFNVQRPEFYYRRDYDSFAKTGRPYEFILLPPCVWQFETTQQLYVLHNSADDAGGTVTGDLLDSDAVGVTRESVVLVAGGIVIGAPTTRIDSLSKEAGDGTVSLGVVPETLTLLNSSGSEGTFFLYAVTPLIPPTQSPGILEDGQSVAVLPAAYVSVIDKIAYPAVSIPGGTNFIGTITYTGTGNFAFAIDGALVVTAAAAATAALKRQRIRLIEIPNQSLTIRVLGKRLCPSFSEDADEPAISGSENLLLTLVLADMLERERQYGRAQAVKAEAAALLEQLKRMEVAQQAHHSRLVPEEGYAPDYPQNGGGFAF